LTFAKRGRGFRVRMESDTGEVVHESWARVRKAMRVFGLVSHDKAETSERSEV
jgi:ribosomal protein L34